jgi:hypothetical protein
LLHDSGSFLNRQFAMQKGNIPILLPETLGQPISWSSSVAENYAWGDGQYRIERKNLQQMERENYCTGRYVELRIH